MNDEEFSRRVQQWRAMPPSTSYIYESDAASKANDLELPTLKEKAQVLCDLFLDASKEQRARLPSLIITYTEEQRERISDMSAAGISPVVADQLSGLHLFALQVCNTIKTTGDIYPFRLGLAALVLIDDRLDPRDLWTERDCLYVAAKNAKIDMEPHVRELAETANPETRALLFRPLQLQ